MKNNLYLMEWIGAAVIFAIGALFHFGFDALGRLPVLSLIFPVNESIWEHGKITFWPPLVYGLIEYFIAGLKYPNMFPAKIFSSVISTAVMIALFYIILWITGNHTFIGDIIIYEISIIVGLAFSYFTIKANPLPAYFSYIAFIILAASVFIFYIFSYTPPKLPVFKCYMTGKYGANPH